MQHFTVIPLRKREEGKGYENYRKKGSIGRCSALRVKISSIYQRGSKKDHDI